MKKIFIACLCFLMYSTIVSAQVITVQTEFAMDVDYRQIESVLMLVRDYDGIEHVIKNDSSNNYRTDVLIADGNYTVESYVVRKDYYLDYPIELNINKDVVPNILTMKVTKKYSTLTTTTSLVENPTSLEEPTTTNNNQTIITDNSTKKQKEKNEQEKKNSLIFTIILVAIPIIVLLLIFIYGFIKYLTTIR